MSIGSKWAEIRQRTDWGDALTGVGALVALVAGVIAVITLIFHLNMDFKKVQTDTLAGFIAETKKPQCVKDELGKILSEHGKILSYQLGIAEENCQILALLAE